MKVWLISAFEPVPSDGTRPMRLMGLADQLLARGHTVHAWVPSFRHNVKAHRFATDTELEVGPSYSVSVLKISGYRKNISPARLLSHRHFSIRLRDSLRSKEPPDLVVVNFPPIGSTKQVASYCKSTGTPLVVDIIDNWPDSFKALLPRPFRPVAGPLFSLLARRAAQALNSCSGVTAISRTYLDWAKKTADREPPKSNYFYPGVSQRRLEDFREALNQKSLQRSPVTVVYAGSISPMYDLETVVRAASILAQGRQEVRFVVAGEGPDRARLSTQSEGLGNIDFVGWLGSESLFDLYCSADAGLCSHRPSAPQSVTYKLFDYLSAGLPIISSLPGEMTDLIETHKLGWYFEPGNAEMLAKRVAALASEATDLSSTRARCWQFAAENGKSEMIYGRMANFLEQAARIA